MSFVTPNDMHSVISMVFSNYVHSTKNMDYQGNEILTSDSPPY